ncbi:MAG: hypothetical protein RL563_2225 [Pseudomonadota bacterium]|jgi:hypothetical protein
MNWELEYKRLLRRLEKQKRKNAALEERIRKLERVAADRTINLTRTIEDSFKHCLANVRMIPVLGIGSNSKILEINVSDKSKSRGSDERI